MLSIITLLTTDIKKARPITFVIKPCLIIPKKQITDKNVVSIPDSASNLDWSTLNSVEWEI